MRTDREGSPRRRRRRGGRRPTQAVSTHYPSEDKHTERVSPATSPRQPCGITALHSACWQGDATCVFVLLQAKADLHAVTDSNATPLMLTRSRDVVLRLLRAVRAGALSESSDDQAAAAAVREYVGRTDCRGHNALHHFAGDEEDPTGWDKCSSVLVMAQLRGVVSQTD